ncbi:MAG: hypothetical protein SH857_06115 [Chitinophagales bacterium]|nr:hypothetical protein [Chitinophagales bacterium]
MISCKKAGELIEKKNAEKLSLPESFQLRLHSAMCDICRLYEKQSKLINNLLKKGLKEKSEPFSDTDVQRIKKKILNQNNS